VRDITLLDDTKKTVSLTLWGELATEQGERLANEIGAVVALRGLRVTDYNGVSLSTVQRSELIVEPSGDDIAAKADALRAWYAAEGSTAETTAAGAGLATARGGGAGGAPAQRVDLKAFQPELLPPATNKAEVGILGCATVVLVKPDQPMYYCACPEEGNNKKVVEESPGKWYCEATQKTYDSCRRRYILRLKVSDHAGGGWVNVFHEQACQMLGCDAEELHALRESNPAAYERKVKAAQFKARSVLHAGPRTTARAS
jgi:replication factor A1